MKSRLKRRAIQGKILDKCLHGRRDPLLQTLNDFGASNRREKRLRKSLGKLQRANAHLVHLADFDKENYFLSLKRETEKSNTESNFSRQGARRTGPNGPPVRRPLDAQLRANQGPGGPLENGRNPEGVLGLQLGFEAESGEKPKVDSAHFGGLLQETAAISAGNAKSSHVQITGRFGSRGR